METSGIGYICTTEDKLTHYLDAVTAQVRRRQRSEVLTHPRLQHSIESKYASSFQKEYQITYLSFQGSRIVSSTL
jgi:hypothetical protein